MGHDVANVRCAIRCAAANQADYGPADVCVVLDGRLIHVGNKTSAAASRSRAMRIDHRLPPIEFLEYRLNVSSPSHFWPQFDNNPTPSAFSVSNAYAISRNLHSTSGSGTTAHS